MIKSDIFHELHAKKDPNLGEYIVKTEPLKSLADLSSKKIIAIGKTGMGKSALYEYLTKYSNNCLITKDIDSPIYGISPNLSDFNYQVIRDQFLLEIIIDLLNEVEKEKEALQAKGISKNTITKTKSFLDKFFKFIKKILGKVEAGSAFGFGLTLRDPKASYLNALKDTGQIQEAGDILKELCQSGLSARVVIDDPEYVFSLTKNININIIAGLVHAAIEISKEHENIKVNVLMNRYYYDKLSHEFKHSDHYPWAYQSLHWTRDLLKTIIEERLDWAINLEGKDKKVPKWEHLFSYKNKKELDKIFEYLSLRVRNGPRDLLLWLGLAHESALQESREISLRGIKEKEKAYSSNILRYFGATYYDFYPNLVNVIRSIFISDPSKMYSTREFRDHLQELLIDSPENPSEFSSLRENLTWLKSISTSSLPELFFELGAICFGGSKDLTKMILPYSEEYTAENFNSAKYVALVPAFQPALRTP